MKIDTWEGCYPSAWKGKIVPDAITHPAKYSSKLIRRIYEHMLEDGWLQPGDLVIDPFGGVALGALDTMRLRLRWRGIELEPHFQELGNQNIDLWNSKFSRMPGWCTDATLLNGDSRRLLEVLSAADGSVSSPPYTGEVVRERSSELEEVRTKNKGMKRAPGMTRGMFAQEGYSHVAGVLSSPPYAESVNSSTSGIDWDKADRPDRNTTKAKGIQGANGHKMKYGATPGQLGAMKAGGFDATVASPPFRQQSGGTSEGIGIGRGDPNLVKRHSASNLNAQGYGASEGQLANMDDGDFDSAVSSPPYERSLTRGDTLPDSPNSQRMKEMKGRLIYGESEGQLGEEKSADDFWQAARTIVEQVYLVLRPGAHAVWVVKGFVKNKQLVDFPGQWRQLCEAVGFVAVHEHHAMLVHGKQHDFERGIVNQTESKSFFRRLAEKKGSPRIDYETVLCVVKE